MKNILIYTVLAISAIGFLYFAFKLGECQHGHFEKITVVGNKGVQQGNKFVCDQK